MSWQSNPNIDPSIWFVGESDGPEWVVVRAVAFPEREASPPNNMTQIAASSARTSIIGHFASVSIANADDAFDPTQIVPALPLWRGYKMLVGFKGLQKTTSNP
jgi:hypothetical protein